MDYVLCRDDAEWPVSVLEDDDCPALYTVGVDGRKIRAKVEVLDEDALLVTLCDEAERQFLVRLGHHQARLGAEELFGEVLDLRTVALRHSQAQSAAVGPQSITTPMPGRVAAVLVEEGQAVAEGEGLVVVEAMKMENELRAPRAGVVRDLAATLGSQVSGGAILCSVH